MYEGHETKYGTVEEMIEILRKLPPKAQLAPFRSGCPEGENVFAVRGVRLVDDRTVALDLVPDEDGSYYADPV